MSIHIDNSRPYIYGAFMQLTENNQKQKRVILLGGSFNPPHPGHFEFGKSACKELGADEVWLLFSINTFKDPSAYEDPEHLLAMGELLKTHYDDVPFVLSTIQHELKTHITYEVLEELSRRNPDTEFIWVMGADNLIKFHTWEHFEDIIEHYQLAVINRNGYNDEARSSYTALSYPHLKRSGLQELQEEKTGFCFFEMPPVDMSSSNLLERLRAGQRQFDGAFQDVADYIVEHGLYGVNVSENDCDNDHEPEPE